MFTAHLGDHRRIIASSCTKWEVVVVLDCRLIALLIAHLSDYGQFLMV